MLGRVIFAIEWLDGIGLPDGPDPARVLPAIRAATMEAAQAAKQLWILRATQKNISDSGDYVRGIQEEGNVQVTHTKSSGLSLELHVTITNTSPHASIVEDGHGAFHLPSRINWGSSPRVKRGKNGPYLHIPFRHHTPPKAGGGATRAATRSQMPQDIYRRAQRLQRRVATRAGPIRNAAGQFLAADRYSRSKGPARLNSNVDGVRVGPGGQAVVHRHTTARPVAGRIKGRQVENPAWQTSRFHGMIKTGPARHTRYLTIRTITPESRGWHIPAQMGHGIAREVQLALTHGPLASRIESMFNRRIQEALA